MILILDHSTPFQCPSGWLYFHPAVLAGQFSPETEAEVLNHGCSFFRREESYFWIASIEEIRAKLSKDQAQIISSMWCF